MKEAVSLFRYVHSDHHIVLEGQIDHKVSADKERILQVITNLLSNAVKFSPENKLIKVILAKKDDEAVVSVQDSGVGIKKSDQKQIFAPYFSLQKNHSNMGLGLGLHICAEIIKLHHGKIWVESKLHQGSTFSFSLPLLPRKKSSNRTAASKKSVFLKA